VRFEVVENLQATKDSKGWLRSGMSYGGAENLDALYQPASSSASRLPAEKNPAFMTLACF